MNNEKENGSNTSYIIYVSIAVLTIFLIGPIIIRVSLGHGLSHIFSDNGGSSNESMSTCPGCNGSGNCIMVDCRNGRMRTERANEIKLMMRNK